VKSTSPLDISPLYPPTKKKEAQVWRELGKAKPASKREEA